MSVHPDVPSSSSTAPQWSPECEALIATLEDGVCLQAMDSRIVRVNRAFAEMLGTTPEQLIGRHCHEVFNCQDNHGNLPVFCATINCLKHNQASTEEITSPKTGQRLRSRVSAVHDAAGQVTGFIMIVRDVTEVVARERELARVEQMSRFGELAAGLAHEIKNPLAGIQGVVDILIQRRAAGDPERSILENVRREVERIDQTVQNLLDRARPRTLNLRPVSLPEILQRTVALARHQIAATRNHHNQHIQIEYDSTIEMLLMPLDAAQIEDAVLNLILNAIAAIEGDGTVTVRLSQQASEIPQTEAVIEVADTGRGIPAEHLSRIFTPFFTTSTRGTGLGLPAVKRIAQAHGGKIEVASSVGNGSTFTLRLPVN